MRWPLRLATLALIAFTLWCTMLYSMQDSMVFPRQYAIASGAPAGAERLTITLSDKDQHHSATNQVEAFLTLPQSNSPVPLVVIFHGNAECVDDLDRFRDAYTSRGWAVLTPEYRGYGRSAGKPSQKAITQDAIAFITQVVQRPDIDPTRVIYHGRSLGGGVAAQVANQIASDHAPQGMIFESTFVSVTSMAAKFGVPAFLVKHPFRTDRVLKTYAGPVLLLHGTSDTIIPVSHSRKLAAMKPDHAAAATRTLIELPGGHNDFPVDEDAYWEAIEGFLRAIG